MQFNLWTVFFLPGEPELTKTDIRTGGEIETGKGNTATAPLPAHGTAEHGGTTETDMTGTGMTGTGTGIEIGIETGREKENVKGTEKERGREIGRGTVIETGNATETEKGER